MYTKTVFGLFVAVGAAASYALRAGVYKSPYTRK